jgi:hypothetical protein
MGLHKRDLSLLLQLQQAAKRRGAGCKAAGSIYINPTLNKVNYSGGLCPAPKKDLTNAASPPLFRKIPFINSESSRFYFV